MWQSSKGLFSWDASFASDCVTVHMSLPARPLMPRLTIYVQCVHGRGEWVAAAGEGGTVDRDWSNNVTNKHRGDSKILLVVVDVYQSMSQSHYVLLSDCAMLRPQQYSLRHSLTVTTNISPPDVHKSQHYRHERINQSIKTHLYSAVCREQIRGTA